MLIASEAAAQGCREGACAPCVVGGKKGTRCCENGKLGSCTPDLEDKGGVRCGDEVCTGGKICQKKKFTAPVCACPEGFDDCGGTCRNLSTDSGNCGACNNVCPSGMSCQPSGPVTLAAPIPGQSPPLVGSVCKPKPGDAVRFDFNMDFVGGTDANGLPLNPQWRFERDHPGELPTTASCHEFSKVVQAGAGSVWVPDLADCTNQTDLSMIDQPQGFTRAICNAGAGDNIAGHVNWFPVTLDGGKIAFETSNDNNIDNDYTASFSFSNLGVNNNHSIHLEFNAFETVENFQTRSWVDFRSSVKTFFSDLFKLAQLLANPFFHDTAAVRRAQEALADEMAAVRQRFDGDTIVTGMFGLDCEHGCKSELHPLYAMATRRDNFENSAEDESWLMFARNVGTEGFCSSKQWAAPFESYTFHLPWREGMTSVEVIGGPQGTQFAGTPGTKGPFVSIVAPNPSVPPPDRKAGVYVQFTLAPAEQKPLIEGTLHLRWTGTGGALGRAAAAPATAVQPQEHGSESAGADGAEARVRTSMAGLSAEQRSTIAQEIARTAPPSTLRPLPPAGPARRLQVAPQVPAVSLSVRGDAGEAVEKQQRDLTALRALCTSTGNAPAGLPEDVCKNVAGPH